MQVLSLFFYFSLVDLHSAQDDTPMCVGGALCGAVGIVFLDRRGRRSLQFNGLPRRVVRNEALRKPPLVQREVARSDGGIVKTTHTAPHKAPPTRPSVSSYFALRSQRSADRPTWNRRKEKEPARSRTFFTRGSVKKARGTSEISGGVLRKDKPFLNSNLLQRRTRKRHYRSHHCVLPSEASQAQPSSGSTALRMTLLFVIPTSQREV